MVWSLFNLCYFVMLSMFSVCFLLLLLPCCKYRKLSLIVHTHAGYSRSSPSVCTHSQPYTVAYTHIFIFIFVCNLHIGARFACILHVFSKLCWTERSCMNPLAFLLLVFVELYSISIEMRLKSMSVHIEFSTTAHLFICIINFHGFHLLAGWLVYLVACSKSPPFFSGYSNWCLLIQLWI